MWGKGFGARPGQWVAFGSIEPRLCKTLHTDSFRTHLLGNSVNRARGRAGAQRTPVYQ
jgi:hypothetical protein